MLQDGRIMSGAADHVLSPRPGGEDVKGKDAKAGRASKLMQSQGPLLALFALVVLFSLTSPNFASLANLVAILEASAIPAVIAIGLTFVLLQASIDLSVEGVASLANVAVAITVANSVTATDIGLWAVPLTICIGAGVGAFNGLVSVYGRMPSLIVTLGAWLMTLGLASLLFPGRTPRLTDGSITSLSIDKTFGLSSLVYIAFALAIVAILVEKHSRFGRISRAIGENESVLRMSGIRINRYKIAAFTLAGICFAVAGLFLAARLGLGNARAGVDLLFPTIAACVVGGTLLSGGHGGVRQSMIGVLILITLRNGLIQIGVDSKLQSAVEGAVIIIAVSAATWHLRRKTRVIK